ncbi:MAG: hypothetical protein ACJ8FY_09300 [Gemmataceae bacterium]
MDLSTSFGFSAPAALLGILLLSGCDSSTAGIHGKVTVDGEPVKNGFIAFYPEGTEGKEASAKIENGEYKVKNVTLGKNKVKVTITEQMEPPAPRSGQRNREAANEERLGKKKARPVPNRPTLDIVDNDQIKDIEAGTSELDIALKTRGKN